MRPASSGAAPRRTAKPRRDASEEPPRAPDEPAPDETPEAASSDAPRKLTKTRRAADDVAAKGDETALTSFEDALQQAPRSAKATSAQAQPQGATRDGAPASEATEIASEEAFALATALPTPVETKIAAPAPLSLPSATVPLAAPEAAAPVIAGAPDFASTLPNVIELAPDANASTTAPDEPTDATSTTVLDLASAPALAERLHVASEVLDPARSAAQAAPTPVHAADNPRSTTDVVPPPPAPPAPPDERAADILRQVRVQILPQARHAVIQLAPAELGKIAIHLRLEREGVVAEVRAEKRVALDALQRHLPELRAAFARQGFDTQRVDLALGFDERRGGTATRDESTRRSPFEPASEIAATHAGDEAPLARWISATGIDTYA